MVVLSYLQKKHTIDSFKRLQQVDLIKLRHFVRKKRILKNFLLSAFVIQGQICGHN